MIVWVMISVLEDLSHGNETIVCGVYASLAEAKASRKGVWEKHHTGWILRETEFYFFVEPFQVLGQGL